MRTLPQDFETLLTPRGRKLLERGLLTGAQLTPERPFFADPGLIDRKQAAACRDVIDRALHELLTPMEDPIPAWTLTAMRENYAEVLPKTVKVRTALLESRRSKAYRRAEEIGLLALLRSEGFGRFAAAIAGRPLQRGWGTQVLCYGEGDYAGPHNDHHPEEPEAKDGYLDLHVTLATPSVGSQFLIYAEGGHFSRMVSVNTVGGITAYRLPFWHYTTPLQAKGPEARRWVLLGTFLFASPGAPERKVIAPPRT